MNACLQPQILYNPARGFADYCIMSQQWSSVVLSQERFSLFLSLSLSLSLTHSSPPSPSFSLHLSLSLASFPSRCLSPCPSLLPFHISIYFSPPSPHLPLTRAHRQAPPGLRRGAARDTSSSACSTSALHLRRSATPMTPAPPTPATRGNMTAPHTTARPPCLPVSYGGDG